MKVFKNEDCNLCVMLNDLFKTSNNITEFLDLFKIDNMKKKEELYNIAYKIIDRHTNRDIAEMIMSI